MSPYEQSIMERKKENSMLKWFGRNTDYYIQTLWDPIQTHAIYRVRAEDILKVKSVLKKNGCTRFRLVGTIICFKEPKR